MAFYTAFIYWAALLWSAVASADSTPPTVQLPAGLVLGGYCPDSSVKLFQGIPYGQPPTGAQRFKPPRAFTVSYSNGILNATKPPAPCIQFTQGNPPNGPPPSEDCLFLNVYVPQTSHCGAVPVKVWAHGGYNSEGSINNPLYSGCNLAADAIVVSFAYRLGALGFLALQTAGVQGNMAIQDYLLALQWVQDNISAFGGNPEQVMLFGQSAGADNVFVVSTLEEAVPLVNGVIAESGGGIDVIPPGIAQYTGSSFAETLGCGNSDLSCLQSKSVEQLQHAFNTAPAVLQNSNLTNMFYVNMPNLTTLATANIDGHLIKEQPLKTGPRVPIIVGTTERENTLYVVSNLQGSPDPITEDTYTNFLRLWGEHSTAVSETYPLSLFDTTGSTAEAVIRAITHVTTTISYTCQNYKTLRAATARGTPAYTYRFNTTSTCPWLIWDDAPFPTPENRLLVGAPHTAELPYVFANLDRLPLGQGSCSATSGERELSKTLVAAWTAMAASANPSTGRQSWPRFDPCETRGVYVQETTEETVLDYSECEFWDGIWEKLGGFTLPPPSCGYPTGQT